MDDDERKVMVSNVTMDTDNTENWWDTVDMTKLILACNKISVIHQDISNLLGLQILDLHDNQVGPDSNRLESKLSPNWSLIQILIW